MWDAPTAAHAICKGLTQELDIMSIVQGNRRWFSFLGVMFGALTSLDVGTENLRQDAH